MTDLLLNVPESSGPERDQLRRQLSEWEDKFECAKIKRDVGLITISKRAIAKLTEQIAQLEAAEMQRRAG